MTARPAAVASGPGADVPRLVLTGTGLPDRDAADAVRVPQVGLGTWPLVGDEARVAVGQGLELGYRHVDTAEKYGNEDVVGRAVRESGLDRAEVFVTSKLTNASFGGVAAVRAGLEATLERMGLEYLDLYLIHWPNPGRSAQEGTYLQTARALAELTGAGGGGILRAWGVSNFTPEHLTALVQEELIPAVNQVQVDLRVGQPLVLEANRRAGVRTAAYSPLGRGTDLLQLPAVLSAARRLDVLPSQVVLRWHVQHGRIVVPRSANPERQLANLAVTGFSLDEDEMAALDALDTGAGPRLDPDAYGH